jgi:HK97 family phage major capsid protein/HK97 family phage prohead protease
MNREIEFYFTRSAGDDRSVTVSFSSETPVLRSNDGEPYYEVLSHREGDYDLSRLNSAAPVLFNHAMAQQIGVVEVATIATKDGRRVGTAKLRFSRSEFASEILKDVQDGVRKNISFGYSITRNISSSRDTDGIPIYRFAWAAHEISVVPCPADNTVGVGRAIEPQLIETRSHNSMNEYSKLLKSIRGEPVTAPSIAETIRALTSPSMNLSREMEDENERLRASMGSLPNSGMGVSGSAFISFETLRRDLSTGVFSQGGALVGEEHLPIVGPLFNLSIAERCGAVIIPGLTSSGRLPRFTTGLTPQSLGESDTGADSTPATDLLLTAPHRVSASVIYDRQWDLTSPGGVKALAMLVVKSLAQRVDSLFLFGQGEGDEPLGIFNHDGISTIAFGGAATFQKITDLEAGLTNANVECDPATTWYVTSPKVKTKLKNAAQSAGVTKAIWETSAGVNYVNGYRAIASNQMAANNQVGFVDFSETALAVYGQGIELQYNPYFFDTQAKTRITAHIWIDTLVSHKEAIAISADAGNQ